jgi:tyrosinase
MAPNDPIIVSYRRAVDAMQRLPTSDTRNWRRQAEIHNNFCPHGNWYFLPWHRAYLAAFERICRQLSGNASFALPYWDWTANPQLPAAFASSSVGGVPNPLFNPTRSSQTVTIPSSVAGAARISTLLAETSFEVFGSTRPTGQNSTASTWQRRNGLKGPFESGPHDQVHVRVSGDMRSFMSPLDPIFWLHHCNIDRLWDSWNRSGRTNTRNSLWRNFAFNGQFVTPSGTSTAPFNIPVSGLQNIESLGYNYVPPGLVAAAPQVRALETLQFAIAPKPVDFSKLQVAARVQDVPLARIDTPVNVTIRLEQPETSALESIRPIAPPANIRSSRQVQARQRVLAIIGDVAPPEPGNAEVRVFINHPDLKPDTSEQDRHFVGSFTFFGTEHANHQGNFSFLLDLTETIRRLNIAEVNLGDGLNVQLVPVPIPGVNDENVEINVGSIEIVIV